MNMDYEKEYKAALGRAKQWYNAPNVDKIPTFANRVIEEIFPELKESEDERIRKDLITFLDDFYLLGKNTNFDKWSKADCSTWIAWLEKMEEHLKFCKTIQIGDRVTRNEGGVLVNMSQFDRIAKTKRG